MNMLLDEVRKVERTADRLYSEDEVNVVLDRMATEMNTCLADSDPLVLCTMNGGVVFMGQLLTRLIMPLTIDYVHATRYRNTTRGQSLEWIRKPPVSVADRNVVIVDDILDEGITLAAIVEACRIAGARNVYTCVMVEKEDVDKADVKIDFLGLKVPNRYVFGCGMDYKGYLRNAAGIFAVNGVE